MSNKDKIAEFIKRQGRISSREIAEKFEVSRQYANLVLRALIAEGRVIKLGGTRGAFYLSRGYAAGHPDLMPSSLQKRYANRDLDETQVFLELEDKFPRLKELTENIRSIFNFAFSEIFNNAIEHSRSRAIIVEAAVRDGFLSFIVSDSGVGVFRHIMKTKGLRSEMEAIQDLLKGKTTTMPKSHSGEGIFFTSKASDIFLLESFGYVLTVDNLNHDVTVRRTAASKRGTRAIFKIKIVSQRHLNDVFKRYANLNGSGDYGFDKTEIRVKLFTAAGVHISRSQARRILTGLEKFKVILFDYSQVPLVGQAFADEIYRVFRERHPDIRLENENMSPGVRFMVERAKNEAKRKR
jgi:anti-sigma regulatory factor (Ser/Thr protein kinase)